MSAILVIADDLTGAAEIAGIALRYGLTVIISQEWDARPDADVFIWNSRTRSYNVGEYALYEAEMRKRKQAHNYGLIYLKFDSAMRGYINLDTSCFMRFFNKNHLLFCPINPLLKRIIVNAEYIADGIPLHQTAFYDDPEFPILTAQVLSLLKGADWQLITAETVPQEAGRFVVEAQTVEALQGLAQWRSEQTIYAGAAAYFAALMERDYSRKDGHTNRPAIVPDLLVCGSSHAASRAWLKGIDQAQVVYWDAVDEQVVQQLLAVRKRGKIPVFAFADQVVAGAEDLRKGMSRVVRELSVLVELRELFIEGGATAEAILEELAVQLLIPEREIKPGFIRSKVKDKNLYISMKPGSYSWD